MTETNTLETPTTPQDKSEIKSRKTPIPLAHYYCGTNVLNKHYTFIERKTTQIPQVNSLINLNNYNINSEINRKENKNTLLQRIPVRQ